jgi:hypothetical protein
MASLRRKLSTAYCGSIIIGASCYVTGPDWVNRSNSVMGNCKVKS